MGYSPLSSAKDHLYGDSFRIAGDAVEEIGNNVSLEFAEMDFGEKGTEKLTVWGRAPLRIQQPVHFQQDL